MIRIFKNSTDAKIIIMLCFLFLPLTLSAQKNTLGSIQEKVNFQADSDSIRGNITQAMQQIRLFQSQLSASQKKLSTDLLQLIDDRFLPEGLEKSAHMSQMENFNQFKPASEEAIIEDQINNGLVYVYIKLNKSISPDLLETYVSSSLNYDERYLLAVAWVRVSNLENLAALDEVYSIRSVLPPISDTGSVITEGDSILRTSDVRAIYSQGGAGIKVGIISDGVDNRATAQASGDLPEDGNGLTVLSNTYQPTEDNDEGTAMLEIVHDMVPDADLYFHDCGANTIAFTTAIDALVAAGCNVICDDMRWRYEPFFEDGLVASHVASVLSTNDIVYVNSTGNYALQHYQGEYYPISESTEHDFSGTGSSYPYLYLHMPAISGVTIVLQWNDEFENSANNYDLFLRDFYTKSIVAQSTDIQNGTQDPLEVIPYISSSTSDFEIVVDRVSGDDKILEVYIYPVWGAYNYSDNITAADAIFSQAAVTGVISVGAIDASDPGNDDIELFSSQGPVTISYPVSEIRDKPDICGIDKVTVTGAGGFPSPFPGTSAAAPHLAAIAAQLWAELPGESGNSIRNRILSSAVDLGSTGYDNIFGYGRADALNAFNDIDTVATPTFSPSPGTYATPQDVTISTTTPGATIHYTINGADPTTGDPVYSAPINISSTTTLKAIAVLSGWEDSDIATGLYTITGTVATPTFSPSPGTYVTPQDVTISTTTPGATIHYTTNGADPTTGDPVYSAPINISSTTTLKAIAVLSGWTDSDIATGLYTITAEAPVADFSGSPTMGIVSFDVNFTDQSIGEITMWDWDFGDGGSSTDQHPLHSYESAGNYTVSLTVTGPQGSDTETKVDYITAYDAAMVDIIDLTQIVNKANVYSASGPDYTVVDESYLPIFYGWWEVDVWGRFYMLTGSVGGESKLGINASPDDYQRSTVADYDLTTPLQLSTWYGLRDGQSVGNVRFVIQIQENTTYTTILDSVVADHDFWRYFEYDLSPWHDSDITLRFITDPNFVTYDDWAHWGEPYVLTSADLPFPGTDLQGNIINSFDTQPGDPAYWLFYTYFMPAYYDNEITTEYIQDIVQSGTGSMRMNWSVKDSEPWGGFSSLMHLHPHPDSVYNFSDYNTLSLWYYNEITPASPDSVLFRLLLYDVSDSPKGESTFDVANEAEVYATFHHILFDQIGWNQIQVPLADILNLWGAEGFYRDESFGIEGNDMLDLNGIKGFAFEFRVIGNGSNNITDGSIIFDHFTLEDNPVVSTTFRCDMAYEIQSGSFNPEIDTVFVHGNFNSWSYTNILLPDPVETTIYEGDIPFLCQEGQLIQYKYAYSSQSLPPQTYVIEGLDPREYTITSSDISSGVLLLEDIFIPMTPAADFTGSPKIGPVPLNVTFSDQSTGEISTWNWNFGDGGSSADQNPSHSYESAGNYTVSLTVTGPGGSDTESKADFITVYADSIDLIQIATKANVYSASGTNWTEVDESYIPILHGWWEPDVWGRFHMFTGSVGGESKSSIAAGPDDYNLSTVADYELNNTLHLSTWYGIHDGFPVGNVRFVIQIQEGTTYTTILDSSVADQDFWRYFEYDLSPWHDSDITLRLITDPNHVTYDDAAHWGEPYVFTSADLTFPDTDLQGNVINSFDTQPGDPAYWLFYTYFMPAYYDNEITTEYIQDIVQSGTGSMRMNWSVKDSEPWGGFSSLIHLHPHPDSVYNFSDYNTLSLWYYNETAPASPDSVLFRLLLYDVSDSPKGESTFDVANEAEVYATFHHILFDQIGWNQIQVPLADILNLWGAKGFYRDASFGIEGNAILDLNRIKGFAFEFRVFGNGSNNITDGSIIFDHFTLEDNPVVSTTFKCDMANEIKSGSFNPETDTVFVRGDFNDWSYSNVLSPNPVDTSIYETDIPLLCETGQSIQYNYAYSAQILPPETYVTEDLDPREHIITATDVSNGVLLLEDIFNDIAYVDVEFFTNLLAFDDEGGAQMLTFGTAIDASDDYDPLYDRYAPPLPPSGAFDARFILGEDAYLADFRSSTSDNIIWNLNYQPTSNADTVTFNWDSSTLPDGNFFLRDNITGDLINIDMKVQDSLHITNLAIDRLQIVYTQEICMDLNINTGWNLVGLPLDVTNRFYKLIFPTCIDNTLYYFDNTYIQEDSLKLNVGYWLRFTQGSTESICGYDVNSAVIDMAEGWNLIAGISSNVALVNVSDPGTIIIPNTLYTFDNVYVAVDSIISGNGYWIRTNAAGQISLSEETPLTKPTIIWSSFFDPEEASSIYFQDAVGQNQILYFDIQFEDPSQKLNYSLPPIPPSGTFDVRFSDHHYVCESDEALITLQGSNYPLIVCFNNVSPPARFAYVLDEFSGSQKIKSHEIQEDIPIQIGDTNIKSLKLSKVEKIPLSFMVSQNYPNPFNPTTEIKFGLPKDEKVDIIIFNTIGQKVKTLISKEMQAGYHFIIWNGTNDHRQKVSTGIYFYLVRAGKHQVIKKMLFLK